MSKVIRPKLCVGTWGEVLNDFRTNVNLTIDEMDEIIVNHNFTTDSLEESHRLLSILWSYQLRKDSSTSNPKEADSR